MRCFIVVKDETGYNGDRTYPKVFKSKELADALPRFWYSPFFHRRWKDKE